MSTFAVAAKRMVDPQSPSKHGPLPLLLVGMTMVTGLVDAFSYLALGHVFVANMTGNIVFLGFALVGAPGFSILASVTALLAFAAGAAVGGRLGGRLGARRGHLLTATAAIESMLVLAAMALAAAGDQPIGHHYRFLLIILLAVAMGAQNAGARQLAVPDLTTTVLTQTITGIAADSPFAGGKGGRTKRRLVSVGAMFVGALIGAAFVIHSRDAVPLGIAVVILAAVAGASHVWGKAAPHWTHRDG